jgi:hypothetical protein
MPRESGASSNPCAIGETMLCPNRGPVTSQAGRRKQNTGDATQRMVVAHQFDK